MFKSILVGYDGTELGRKALETGASLAKSLGGTLYAISVIPDIPTYAVMGSEFGGLDATAWESLSDSRDNYAESLKAEARKITEAEGVTAQVESSIGNIADEIIRAANSHACDLIVVGQRLHPGLIAKLTHATTAQLMLHAQPAVLCVH